MADELTVIIKLIDAGKSEVESFHLPVEQITHTFTRNPVVFPIPGVNIGTTGKPVVFALDFGMLSEQLTLQGSLKDNIDEWNTRAPNLFELTNAVRTWWRHTNVVSTDPATAIANKIFVKGGPGQGDLVYLGVIQGATLTRLGGTTWWAYKLTFQIVGFPPDIIW